MKRFLTSSADPTKLSLMVKGFLMALVPLLMIWTGLTEADLTGLIGYIEQIVYLITSLYAVGAVLFGALRKLYLGRWNSVE